MSDAKTVSIVDEPTTLIVSKHGWLRSRTGHNIDPTQLTFRSGDSLLACLPCRTVDSLILLDTKGRAYSIPGVRHSRRQGRRHSRPPRWPIFVAGAKPCLALAVQGEKLYLVAASGGYGFRCKGEDLLSRGKAGKAFMTLPEGEAPVVFTPAPAGDVACITRDGRALVFSSEEIRLLPKGRGLKLIDADPGKTALEDILPVVDGIAGKLKGERLEVCRGIRGGKGKP